tara:strand:- start:52 stop:1242 length:1191 start_codon:yes stop_codon:yes gene_type:complete
LTALHFFLTCKNFTFLNLFNNAHKSNKKNMPPPTRRERGKVVTTINTDTRATHTKFVSPQSTPKGRREKKNDDETPEPPGGDSVVDDDDDSNDDVEMMTMKETEERDQKEEKRREGETVTSSSSSKFGHQHHHPQEKAAENNNNDSNENVQIHARLMEMLKHYVKIGQASGVPGKDVPVDLIAKAFVSLGKAIGNEESDDVVLDRRKILDREMAKYEQDVVRKLKHAERAAEREITTYEKELARLEKKFVETEEEVKRLKSEVKALREDGKSEVRREKLRAEIGELPEKKVSERTLKALEEEIARLEKENLDEEKETNEAMAALETALASITKLPGEIEDVVVVEAVVENTNKNANNTHQSGFAGTTTLRTTREEREQKEDAPMLIQDAAEDGEIV